MSNLYKWQEIGNKWGDEWEKTRKKWDETPISPICPEAADRPISSLYKTRRLDGNMGQVESTRGHPQMRVRRRLAWRTAWDCRGLRALPCDCTAPQPSGTRLMPWEPPPPLSGLGVGGVAAALTLKEEQIQAAPPGLWSGPAPGGLWEPHCPSAITVSHGGLSGCGRGGGGGARH